MIKVNSSRVKLFLKRKTDQGRVTITPAEASATDPTTGKLVGKVVSLTESFIDVDSITLSIQGTPDSSTGAKYAIYDFKDEPNPDLATGFRIFVFTTTGGSPSVDTTVDFTVRGV